MGFPNLFNIHPDFHHFQFVNERVRMVHSKFFADFQKISSSFSKFVGPQLQVRLIEWARTPRTCWTRTKECETQRVQLPGLHTFRTVWISANLAVSEQTKLFAALNQTGIRFTEKWWLGLQTCSRKQRSAWTLRETIRNWWFTVRV